jgi:tRNA (guanine37-N1)-methyltransferase
MTAVPWTATVLTLFPEMFPGPLGHSLAGRSLEDRHWAIEAVGLRDFALDRHRSVDDEPFGGGAGMVMRPDVVAQALDAIHPAGDPRPGLYLTPRGVPLTQDRVRALAEGPGAVILCGRFEGVDQRVIDARGIDEVSIGDIVLSGGEPAAICLIDACVRLLPGVIGSADSLAEESFADGLLEYPHYTRPQLFENRSVPAVLLSGHHGRVRDWRRQQAEEITRRRRPDLWQRREAMLMRARGAAAPDRAFDLSEEER